MSKEKMTIHRALSELKMIDARITKQIEEIAPVAIYQKDKLINGHIRGEDFKANAISKYQSITDLITRKSAIKTAIVSANSVTKVKIGEKEMTIADAITLKTAIKLKTMLADRMKMLYVRAAGELNKNNDVIQKNTHALLETVLGKDSVKAEKNDVEAISKPYVAANEFHLCDPLNVADKIQAIEKEVSTFEAEVDAVLSEINATTFIEI